jgi:hypothetical protein
MVPIQAQQREQSRAYGWLQNQFPGKPRVSSNRIPMATGAHIEGWGVVDHQRNGKLARVLQFRPVIRWSRRITVSSTDMNRRTFGAGSDCGQPHRAINPTVP